MTDSALQDTSQASSQPTLSLPPLIAALLESLRLAPSNACIALLWFAAWRSHWKSEYRDEISCSGTFFAALAFPRSAGALREVWSSLFENPAHSQELVVLNRLREMVETDMGTAPELLSGRAEHYRQIPEFTPTVPARLADVAPTSSFTEALRTFATEEPRQLDIQTLLQAILQNEKAALRVRLSEAKIDPAWLITSLKAENAQVEKLKSEQNSTASGHTRDLRLQMNRDVESATELSLGIEVYSAALATILRTARGEFCFGLFGRWGSGKTRLAKHLQPLLESPHDYAEAMRARGYAVGSDPDDRIRYEVVWYSAWKFRRPPEAWIFLYETMAAHCLRVGLFQRMGRVLRVGVARNGYWPLVLGLLTLGLAALPFDSWIRFAGLVISLVGLTGLIYGFSVIRRGRETIRSLASRYAMLTRHGERLGMQALIGDDLRALTLGWIPVVRDFKVAKDGSPAVVKSNAFERRHLYGAVVLLGAFGLAWASAILSPPTLTNAIKGQLRSFCGTLVAPDGFWCAVDGSSSTNWAIYLAVFGAWFVISTLVLWAVHFGGSSRKNSIDRILLVVDDLDRCSPAEAIDIAESLKLLLEDEIIQKRVQVLMLVDEDVLEHATADKFKSLIEDRATRSSIATQDARHEIVHEHFEKLFACHLRLPPLNDAEIGELARRYAQVDVQRRRAARLAEIDQSISQIKQPSLRPTRQRTVSSRRVLRSAPRSLGDPIEMEETFRQDEDDAELAYRMKRYEEDIQEKVAPLEREKQEILVGIGAPLATTSADLVPNQLAGSELRFNDDEVTLFEAELAKNMSNGGRRPSPRAIRIFLFKYQLCHLLLQLSHDVVGRTANAVEPKTLLTALATASFGGRDYRPPIPHQSRAAIDCVVAQVA